MAKEGEGKGKRKKHLHQVRIEAAKDGTFVHHHTYKNHPDDEHSEPERMVSTSGSPEEAGQQVAEQLGMNQPQQAGPPDAQEPQQGGEPGGDATAPAGA